MKKRESGFSLVELLIAMVVTLLISSAIFALVKVAQETARRTPVMAERQQNLRSALVMLQRDVENGGQLLPSWRQVFTDGLNGAGVANASGGNTDILEIFGNDGVCPDLDVCKSTGASITTKQTFPACVNLPGLAMLYNDKDFGVFWLCPPGNGQNQSCSGKGDNGHAVMPHGRAPEFNPPGGPPFTPTKLAAMQVDRYEIHIDSTNAADPWHVVGDGSPNLWRSPHGGVDTSGSGCGGKGPGGGPDTGWKLIARGIEDMQIQYRVSGKDAKGNLVPGAYADPENPSDATFTAGAWQDVPGTVVETDYSTIVREVKITLVARTVGEQHLQGESIPAVGSTAAIRGSVTTSMTPRAALLWLQTAPGGAQWR